MVVALAERPCVPAATAVAGVDRVVAYLILRQWSELK
jgi:hypothetical protein